MTWPASMRGHPGHRHEDAAPAGHLDDQAQHPRRLAADRAASTTTSRTRPTWSPIGSNSGGAGQARDEDPRRRAAHGFRLPAVGQRHGVDALGAGAGPAGHDERQRAARRGRRPGRLGGVRAGATGVRATRPAARSGSIRTTRDSRAHRAGCSSPSGGLRRLACSSATTVSQPRRPARRSRTVARNVTTRPQVSLLRAVTSTSAPSGRSGSGCSSPPPRRARRRRPRRATRPALRLVPVGRSHTSADLRQASSTSARAIGRRPGRRITVPSVPHADRCGGWRWAAGVTPTAECSTGPPSTVASATAGRPGPDGRRDPGRVDVRTADGGDRGARTGCGALAQRARAGWRSGPSRWSPGVRAAPGCQPRERALGLRRRAAAGACTSRPGCPACATRRSPRPPRSCATQPVWVALIARATGHDVPRRAWLGIAISLVAVVVLHRASTSRWSRARSSATCSRCWAASSPRSTRWPAPRCAAR